MLHLVATNAVANMTRLWLMKHEPMMRSLPISLPVEKRGLRVYNAASSLLQSGDKKRLG